MCHGQMIGESIQRARKVHRCDLCKREIVPGRRYYRGRWILEGEQPETVKRCRLCFALGQEAVEQAGDGCFYGNPYSDAKAEVKGNGEGWREMLARLRSHVWRWRSLRSGGA